jgi:hypothetical protein
LEREEERLDREEERLDREEEETIAKLMQLRRQHKFLRSRSKDMLRRGLTTLDELDEVKAHEQRKAEAREQEKPKPPVPVDTLSPPSLDPALAAAFASFDPSDPYWVLLGFGEALPSKPAPDGTPSGVLDT